MECQNAAQSGPMDEAVCTCRRPQSVYQHCPTPPESPASSSSTPMSPMFGEDVHLPVAYNNSPEKQIDSPCSPGDVEFIPMEAQLQILRKQLAQLRQEKQNASRQIREISKMNSRWQKYDKEREVVVIDLTARHHNNQEQIAELQEQVRLLDGKLLEQVKRNEDLELRWTDARVRASERKSALERAQRENQELQLTLKQSEKKRQEANRRLEGALREGAGPGAARGEDGKGRREVEKDRDLYHMSKRVVDLKEKVDHLEMTLEMCKKEMDEQADLYRQQISICLDDFKQEKRDKERTKTENNDLRKQLKKAEDFASSLKAQITRYQEQRPNHRGHPGMLQPSPSACMDNKRHARARSFDEVNNSWDDAGYALPSDVVRDRTAYGYDQIDGDVDAAVDTAAPTATPSPVDPPPQYDDRSIMGRFDAQSPSPSTTCHAQAAKGSTPAPPPKLVRH